MKKDAEKREAAVKACKERGYREMRMDILKQRSGERNAKVTLYYYPGYNYFAAPEVRGARSVTPKGRKGAK